MTNDDGLEELITVIKGPNPSTRQRVGFQAKLKLTLSQSVELKRVYIIGNKLENNPDFLDDFRIVRANFTTYTHYSKIKEDSFKVAIRNSRKVFYNCRGQNGLVSKSFQPPPYMVISFKRINRRIPDDFNI